MRPRVLVLALLVAMPAPLLAQVGAGSAASARAALTQAIRAYQDLDFDLAATLLQRALSGAGGTQLADTERVRALTYLGAAEYYRAQSDSATSVFRQLVLLAPGYQPDTLTFPPEVTRLFSEVRGRTDEVKVASTDTASRPPAPQSAPPPRQQTTGKGGEQAHRGIAVTGGGSLVNVRAQSEAGGLPPASGTVLGVTTSVQYGRFEVGVRYMEGSLESRHLVEGAAALRFVTTPWLALHTGPQIRRYETPSAAERWVTWQFGARAEAPIMGSRLRGHALLWQGLVLSVNVPPGSGTATGGEVGVTLDVAPGPLWFGVAYAMDQASVSGSSRRETVGALTITAGVRRLP